MPRHTLEFVPSTFEELYKHYYPYVARLVATSGIPHQDVDDVAQTLLMLFYEKGVLEDFDPEHDTTYKGVTRRALFRTFLSGFVKTYVRHYRDRIKIHAERERLLVNVPVFEQHEWGVFHIEPYEETFEVLNEVELVNDIRWQMSTTEPNGPRDRCDLPALFNAVLEQSYRLGQLDVKELSEQFNVSKTTMHRWLDRMREQVRTVIEE